MPIRQRSLLELSTQSKNGGTNPSVRSELEIYSSNEVDNLISSIDLTPYALNSTVNTISGQVTTLDSEVALINSRVDSVSASLTTDIQNVDLALSQKIATETVQSIGVSGASTTVIGYLNVTINGTTYKLALVN